VNNEFALSLVPSTEILLPAKPRWIRESAEEENAAHVAEGEDGEDRGRRKRYGRKNPR